MATPAPVTVDARGVEISSAAYPGTISLEIDATNLGQRVFGVRQRVPVSAGERRFHYPAWLPGNHSPTGQIEKLAGLVITAKGQRLDWQRDPLDVYTFNVRVPEGVTELQMDYQFLSPTDPAQGRTVMTPNLLNLQWNAMVLYPAGHAANAITYAARVRYPAGWQAASALPVARRQSDTVHYVPANLEVLVDSPVFAGRYSRTIELSPEGSRPVRLNVFADRAKDLDAKPEHIELHRKLVEQARTLFGAEHYDHYDFLFAVTSQLGGIGLEHQRSSENTEDRDYFSGWDEKIGSTDLLGHEYTHSWDGKYRRPADLTTSHYNVPMQGSLLWVYEGQTQYWGNVLTARAGLRPLSPSRDALALVAATYADNRPGLEWRSMGDTTNDPVIARRKPKPYRGYQMSEDYYQGGQLLWLETDVRLRTLSAGKVSLDDFARSFFGQNDGQWERPSTYTFDDVVATLEQLQPSGDWNTFLRDRVEGRIGLTGGIEASGWKLVYRDTPSSYQKAMSKGRDANFTHSLGLVVGDSGKVGDVRWDSPAFNAGIGPGMQLVAVNGLQYSATELEDAVRAAKDSKEAINLLVKDVDTYRTLPITYTDGLRYPHLERIEGSTDYLTPIFTARE
nr:peptidase M61 [Stenotrophomonas koreensis]